MEKDKRLLGAGALFILGNISLVIALALSAEFFWLGTPKTTTPLRLILGVLVGGAFCIIGFRLASQTYLGSLQAVLHACAGAGVLFLGIIFQVNLHLAHWVFPPIWLLTVMELPLLWLLITRRKLRPRRLQKTSLR